MVPDIEVDHDGSAWFNVRLDYRETDPDQEPELKSDNAERKLPIHPALWRDEGFADYVAGLPKGGPLFPALTPDRFGRRGGNGSKRVQRWVRDKVKIKDKRKAPSHSWRHRFRSIVRNPTYGLGEDSVRPDRRRGRRGLTLSAPGEAPLGRAQGDNALNRDLTLLHVPCINIPAGLGPNRLPVGLTLTGPRYSDRHLLIVAAAMAPVLDLAVAR